MAGGTVLYTLAVVFFVLWLLGVAGGYIIGALVHLLLVLAIALVVTQLVLGRRVSG